MSEIYSFSFSMEESYFKEIGIDERKILNAIKLNLMHQLNEIGIKLENYEDVRVIYPISVSFDKNQPGFINYKFSLKLSFDHKNSMPSG